MIIALGGARRLTASSFVSASGIVPDQENKVNEGEGNRSEPEARPLTTQVAFSNDADEHAIYQLGVLNRK